MLDLITCHGRIMPCLAELLFSKNISAFSIFNDQSFNDTLTNDIFSFEQLGPGG